MIFVTVGSQKFPFDRLLRTVDQMVRDQMIADEVFMQTGTSSYVPICRHQPFCSRELFEEMMEQCDILITHGGAGTMIDAVRMGKKVIAVPRLTRFGEHVDDHQLELTEQLHRMNLVCACLDASRLASALETVRNHRFDAFPSNTETFIASLDGYLSTLQRRSSS